MARNIRLTGVAFALVAAALFGSLVSQTIGTAEAQIVEVDGGPAPVPHRGGFPPAPAWEQAPDADNTDAVADGVDLGALGELDVLACSLTDGCSLPVAITTEGGEILKLMVITFEDMPEDDATP